MRVTSKGQITIPKHIRERRGIYPGTDVEVTDNGDEVVVRKTAGPGKDGRPSAEEFKAYLDRVTGTINLGMTTDEYMEFLRGE